MARPILSGAYAICNLRTGAPYIGCTGNIGERYNQHRRLLQAGQHTNEQIQADRSSYGAAFGLIILERGSAWDYAVQLAERERSWIRRAQRAGIALCNKPGRLGQKKETA